MGVVYQDLILLHRSIKHRNVIKNLCHEKVHNILLHYRILMDNLYFYYEKCEH